MFKCVLVTFVDRYTCFGPDNSLKFIQCHFFNLFGGLRNRNINTQHDHQWPTKTLEPKQTRGSNRNRLFFFYNSSQLLVQTINSNTPWMLILKDSPWTRHGLMSRPAPGIPIKSLWRAGPVYGRQWQFHNRLWFQRFIEFVDVLNVTLPREKFWSMITRTMTRMARNPHKTIRVFESGENIILIPTMEKHGLVRLEHLRR